MTKILIVDDAAFMRMKTKKLLAAMGYDVVEASNGAEAVDTYKRTKPDCVLLDITMPDMDGLTALKLLLALDPNARVTMLTAMGQQTIVLEALQSGAVDFIVKPFDSARVLAAVEKMVA
ncbi:MAG: response regulator [Chloroflexi bacterium]|nr:response regulator [Chloroflexota bacterium]